MSSISILNRFVTRNRHFRDGKLYITCIAKISDVYHAEVKDAAVGILGNVTQQTNQIVIGASPSKNLVSKYKWNLTFQFRNKIFFIIFVTIEIFIFLFTGLSTSSTPLKMTIRNFLFQDTPLNGLVLIINYINFSML